MTDPELLQTIYTHDGLNNLDALNSPDTGVASYSQDAAGNRSSQTDARGVTSTYSHDALNRLTGIAYPTASLDVTYQYDQPDSITGCVGSFPQGRLTRMIDSAATTVYCYDRRGNLTRKLQDHGGVKKTTAYTWTRADRLESLSYPSGGLAGYTHDAVGRVAGVSWSLGGKTTTVLANIAWYPFGPARVLTYGNGRTSTRSYDANYAIDSIVASPAGGLTLDYDSDILGNLVGLSAAAGANPPDRVYDYDALYRLTQVHAGANLLESYTYTPTGDRASALTSAGTQIYAYEPGSHRLASVGGVSRAYDANGNTTSGIVAGITQEYDQRNRLIRVRKGGSAMHYFHNGRGERVVKAVKGLDFGAAANEHYYIYDQGGAMLGDYQPSVLQRELIYLAEQPVGVVTQVGKARPRLAYVEPDHLGTPRSVIDPATNQALWKWDLRGNAFGNDAPNDDPDGNGQGFGFDWRFPGQYRDAETGLSYNYFRDYEPGTGRYIESDPIGLSGGINTFAYAANATFFLIDPLGLASCRNCCANHQWRTGESDMAAGGVECCGGRMVPCVNPRICEGKDRSGQSLQYPNDACNLLKDCARKHEKYHIDNGHIESCTSNDGPPSFRPEFAGGRGECDAYGNEIPCLNIAKCKSHRCELVIRQIQAFKIDKKHQSCGRAGR